MSKLWCVAALLLSLGTFASSGSDPRPQLASSARISVGDISKFATIGDPGTTEWDDEIAFREAAVISPDGAYAAVVVRRGNVEKLSNDGALLIYSLATVISNPSPVAEFRMSSLNNRQPIALIRWLGDSRRIAFAGTQNNEMTQIYLADIRNGALAALTRTDTAIETYAVSPDGQRVIAMLLEPRIALDDRAECRASGCRVVDTRLSMARDGGVPQALLVQFTRGVPDGRQVPSPELTINQLSACEATLPGGLSLDGRYVARVCSLRKQPEWWGNYRLDPYLQECMRQGWSGCAGVLVVTDLSSGTSRVVSEAPFVHGSASVIWLDKSLLIVGSYLPVSEAESANNTNQLAIVAVDPASLEERVIGMLPKGEVTAAASFDVKLSELSIESRHLTIDDGDLRHSKARKHVWRRKGDQWIVQAESRQTEDPARVQLSVTQSLNDRPRLIAHLPTGERTVVLDPNEFLETKALGRVETVAWTARDGRKWEGGLYLPPDLSTDRRYPLLIQTHGFDDTLFSMTGRSRNFAARAMAAHDIVVLQVRENQGAGWGTPLVWTAVANGYESAIDFLSERGLVDQQRVGVQGWSSTGPQLGYLLTHSSYPIRAAAFTDSGDYGWWFYLLDGASTDIDSTFGGPPFGVTLEGWLENSPTFNLDRVVTPMLLMEAGYLGLAGLWDWYAGLRRLNKPVEYWVLPNAEHDFFMIGHRLRANQLLVDWFRFWLADVCESTAEECVRWQEMRRQFNAASERERPPLLDWTVRPAAEH